MVTPKAYVTQVPLGHLSVQGLMDENQQFYIAVPQIADHFQFLIKNTSRDFKALLGEGFQFLKFKTELNPKAVNCLTLPQFEKLLVELAITKQHPLAIEMVRSLAGLSLHQLFCDAFKIKFEAAERQEWLLDRQECKELTKDLASAIGYFYHSHKHEYELDPEYLYYVSAFEAVSLCLFGMQPRVIKAQLGLKKGALNRDHFGRTALRRITTLQEVAANLLRQDYSISPRQAVYKAHKTLGYNVTDYRA